MLQLLRRALSFLRRDRLDAELAEEIREHLDLRRRALIADGMSPAEAEREARWQFGNVTAIRERARESWAGAAVTAAWRRARRIRWRCARARSASEWRSARSGWMRSR
jgi:hypothetical protein